ncbi:DUF6346 domain-containing protein [Amycolatopsis thailandensis]|uniref:DUF6346 domain-containing protein n=1 Tax=Amycolatopsis thailandensis TaxID=589330 RepID=UPI00365BFAEE
MKTVSRGLVAWIAILLLLLASLTLLRLADAPLVNGAAAEGAPATAVVKDCERFGPVSSGGVGYFHECTAAVSVSGQVEIVEFGPDELSPSDEASPVGVTNDSGEWRRIADHPFGFLEVLGIVFIVSCVFAAFSTGWQEVFGRLTFRNRSPRKVGQDPSETDVIELLTPDNTKFLARYLFLAISGLGLMGIGGTFLVITDQLRTGGFWQVSLGGALVLLGALVLGSVVVGRRVVTKSIPLVVTAEGLVQPLSEGAHLLLPWDEIKSLVFDDHVLGEQVSIHVVLVDQEAEVLLREELRGNSRFGHVLASMVPAAEAERAAAIVERFKPGVSRWPARGIKRGGFGLVTAVRRTVLRWKDSTQKAKAESPGDGLTISRISDAKQHQRLGLVFLAFTLILGFAVFRDGRLGVRIGLGFFGLLFLSATAVAFRYHLNPFTRQLVFKPRWLTVVTKTARTRAWSIRWRDIDKAFVQRTPDAACRLVLCPAEVVDSYYPRESLARPLGLARESDRFIVISEIELTAEEIDLILPVLRKHVEVVDGQSGGVSR